AHIRLGEAVRPPPDQTRGARLPLRLRALAPGRTAAQRRRPPLQARLDPSRPPALPGSSLRAREGRILPAATETRSSRRRRKGLRARAGRSSPAAGRRRLSQARRFALEARPRVRWGIREGQASAAARARSTRPRRAGAGVPLEQAGT